MKTRKIDWLATAGICCADEGQSLGSTLYGGGATTETTAAETPAVETPAAETPVVETPVAETPAAETPAEQTASAVAPAPEGEVPAALTPESYTFTYPEGFQEDAEVMSSIKAIFAETKMPVDKAQALINTYAEQMKAAVTAGITAQRNQFTELNTKWVSEVNTMPEFQGEAKKQTSTMLGRVWDEYGSPEAREAFSLTGAGNNPAVVRMFLKMAAALSEGRPATPGNPAGQAPSQQTRGQKLYGPKT